MGISLRTVEQLRQQGYDAMHLAEQRLERLADADILAKARTEGRVLLTGMWGGLLRPSARSPIATVFKTSFRHFSDRMVIIPLKSLYLAIG
jgi:hypothetical protein